MRRSTPVLVILLLASLLSNALLAVRLSRAPEPVAARPSPAAVRPPASESPESLKEALEAERKKNRDLHARIEGLETDKKVLAQEAPGTGKPDKLAAFREKLRKMKKILADPALKGGNGVEPEVMVELTDAMMEFMKMTALRGKEPKAYTDYLQAFYEVGLEGEGTTLTADQTAALGSLLKGFGEELAGIPAVPAGDHLLKEVLLEASTIGRVQALLTDAQRAALGKDQMDVLGSMNALTTAYVTKDGAAGQIAQQWSALYQLDAAQLPQARAAAQSYVDAMARLSVNELSLKAGSPEAYEYRVKAVREQLAALSLLQGSMTPAQAERLRTQTMKEFRIVDVNAQVEAASTPDK